MGGTRGTLRGALSAHKDIGRITEEACALPRPTRPLTENERRFLRMLAGRKLRNIGLFGGGATLAMVASGVWNATDGFQGLVADAPPGFFLFLSLLIAIPLSITIYLWRKQWPIYAGPLSQFGPNERLTGNVSIVTGHYMEIGRPGTTWFLVDGNPVQIPMEILDELPFLDPAPLHTSRIERAVVAHAPHENMEEQTFYLIGVADRTVDQLAAEGKIRLKRFWFED